MQGDAATQNSLCLLGSVQMEIIILEHIRGIAPTVQHKFTIFR